MVRRRNNRNQPNRVGKVTNMMAGMKLTRRKNVRRAPSKGVPLSQYMGVVAAPKRSRGPNRVMSQMYTNKNYNAAVPTNAGSNMSTGSRPLTMSANVVKNLGMVKRVPNTIDPTTDHKFIHCRLNPFATEGSLGIPDGSHIRKFIVDYRCFADITFTAVSGPVDILFTPTLPSFAYIRSQTSGAMNITSPNGGIFTYTITSADYKTGWFPFMYPSELSSTVSTTPISAAPGAFKAVPSVYDQTKSRIVTIAHKIYYTGQASLASNTLTVSATPFEVVEGELTLNTVAAAINTNNNSSAAVAAVNTVNTIPADFRYAPSTLNKNSVSSRVELGAYIMLHHDSAPNPNVYRWVPNYDAPVFFMGLTNQTPILNAAQIVGGGAAIENYGAVTSFDFDWTPVVARLSGGTSGHSYRVESVYCVEYMLAETSPFERASVRGTLDPVALKSSTFIANNQPLSVPVATNPQSWVDEAIEIATKVGSAVSPFLKFLL